MYKDYSLYLFVVNPVNKDCLIPILACVCSGLGQYLPRNLWFLKWKALTKLVLVAKRFLDNFAFGRLRTSSEDFGLLRKTLDFFGNLRKWSVVFKNLTPISQKKLAGIQTGTLFCFFTDGKPHKVCKFDMITIGNCAPRSYMTWLPLTLAWLLYNLQVWHHKHWFPKFTVCFRPIRKEIASSMYNNKFKFKFIIKINNV